MTSVQPDHTVIAHKEHDGVLPFCSRGPASKAAMDYLTGANNDGQQLSHIAMSAAMNTGDILTDDDLQLALHLLYASSYGTYAALRADREWDLNVIAMRLVIEVAFESALRERVTQPELPEPTSDAVARALFRLVDADDSPSVSRFVAKRARDEQLREFLMLKSIYTLREADPHSWAIPRLSGAAKVALVEVQSDEYGGGDPRSMHAELYAKSLRSAGLSSEVGTYVDCAPAVVLMAHNVMSLFGLNRRLRGAVVGHLAAFEMTSSIPNRLYADGMRRLGYTEEMTEYFDVHVTADAVHEQIAARDLAGGLVESDPTLLSDIMFGAAACLWVEGLVGSHVMLAWQNGGTALREVAVGYDAP